MLRAGLLALAIPQALVSTWALAAPHSFYVDFPVGGRRWIAALGAENGHLAFDYGAASLGLVAVMLAAAIRLESRLIYVAVFGWLVWAVPHLAYHAATAERLPLIDSLVNMATLASAVALPLALLAVVAGSRR